MQIVPYLMFKGNCREAFTFYEQVLGGKITAMFTNAEIPAGEQGPPGPANLIMHARLTAGGAELMGSDCPPEHYEQPKVTRVSLSVEEPGEADRIFAALSEGATVEMPIQATFWALRFGMLTDRFGTPWMINCEKTA